MRIFSTFTGIGGFEVGIQNAIRSMGREKTRDQRVGDDGGSRANDNTESGRIEPQRSICVGYSEIDKYAISVYEKQFPGVKNYGDITKINAKELPDFDCLVGGFPCQAFSIAGKRRGFDDTRGTLFFDLARILREKQPRYFVFENVKGLLSHDQGNTFRTIIATIDELGYDCQWSVLNSKDFGVPQNRERVYIVGHLRGTPRPEVFPITENSRADIILPTLTTRYYGAQANVGYIGNESPQVGTYRTHKDGNGFRKSRSGLAPTIPARAREDGSGQPVMNDGVRVRRLTPLECERLQGFPDNWTAQGTDGAISDTQRYKMCGNAVTTNVVQAVFERILTNDQL